MFGVFGLLLVFAALQPARAAFGDRITVSGTEFRAGNDPIWINGANTPWHSWNDFAGKYDRDWWDNHFRQLHENGINATRVWISCSGEAGVQVDSKGNVLGCTKAFWNNLDSLFHIAQKRQVYIMATLISFDHFSNHHAKYRRWRKVLQNDATVDSLVRNYIVPFVCRYGDNPWLWSVDLCNEPDWVHENANCGQLPWDRIQTYIAKSAVAVHANSKVLVTVGFCMGSKYNSAALGENVVSDTLLQARVGGDTRAFLDFYSPHHYDWMSRNWGNPFYMLPAVYGVGGTKPVLIGECPAKGTSGHTTTEDYEAAYRNGWQGAMAWTSNGVDAMGNLIQLGPATRQFRDRHFSLVFPKLAGREAQSTQDHEAIEN